MLKVSLPVHDDELRNTLPGALNFGGKRPRRPENITTDGDDGSSSECSYQSEDEAGNTL